jgi:hypothetical protein
MNLQLLKWITIITVVANKFHMYNRVIKLPNYAYLWHLIRP